jgi:two-component system OmpR family sensor kinase
VGVGDGVPVTAEPRPRPRAGRLALAERLRVPLSARLRILGWILVLAALAVVGALVLSRRILLQQLDGEVNDRLERDVEEIRQLVEDGDPATGRSFGADVATVFDTYLSRNAPVEGDAYYTFVDGRFHAATSAPEALGEDPRAGRRWAQMAEPDHGELDTGAGRVRWLALPLQDRDGRPLGVFVAANFLQDEREEISQAIDTGLVMAVIVLLLAALVGWGVAGRILRPIREVTDAARAIGETDLSRRIEVDGRDEVAELARTFNAMLDRLERAFATQRAFIDDAGHELRTPITIVRGHLELLGDDPDERRETVALVTDELDRMTRIVDDLLVLAKLEHPDFLRLAPLEVAPFTRDVFAKAGALAALDGRRWQLADVADVTVVADAQRLTQALMNLVRNAAEHTGPGGTVELGSTAGSRTAPSREVTFWVADSGSGIAPEEQTRIFERFVRGGDRRRRSEGAGLGLAIVRAVAEAHGGRVAVASRPGAGSRFTITLPTRTGPGGGTGAGGIRGARLGGGRSSHAGPVRPDRPAAPQAPDRPDRPRGPQAPRQQPDPPEGPHALDEVATTEATPQGDATHGAPTAEAAEATPPTDASGTRESSEVPWPGS